MVLRVCGEKGKIYVIFVEMASALANPEYLLLRSKLLPEGVAGGELAEEQVVLLADACARRGDVDPPLARAHLHTVRPLTLVEVGHALHQVER